MTPLFKIPSAVGNLCNLFRQIFRNISERTPRSSKDIRIVEGTTGWHAELATKTKTTGVVIPGFPFQVYVMPDEDVSLNLSIYRETNPGHDWRRVFVRAGYINLLKVLGTDAQNYPDEKESDEENLATNQPLRPSWSQVEIVVPNETQSYYIWVRAKFELAPPYTLSKGQCCIEAEIFHGVDPTLQGWDGFPQDDFGDQVNGSIYDPQNRYVFFLVAVCDTLTPSTLLDYSDDGPNEIKIRQFLREDVEIIPPSLDEGNDYEPFATTDPAKEVTANSAILNATVDGGNMVTTVWFEYGLTAFYGHETARIELPNGLRVFETDKELPCGSLIDGLLPGLTYHFRVRAQNNEGSTAGDDETFNTIQSVRAGRYPFKVYSLSQAERTEWGAPDPTGTGSWRKFFVSSGYVNLVPAENTDECLYPDNAFTAANPPNLADSEIEVPENTEKYYVYLEAVFDNLGVTHVEVWHSTDPTTDGWDDFDLGKPISAGVSMTPDPGAGPASIFYLIAIIDTKAAYALPTYNDDNENTIAYVRQFQRADINSSVADALRLREYAVCVDDVTKYAILPSRPETAEPTL